MSNSYWKNLANVSCEDSELLKDYHNLSEKINDYYQDHDYVSEMPRLSYPEAPVKKHIKPARKMPVAPNNLEMRAQARFSRPSDVNSPVKRSPIKRSSTVKDSHKVPFQRKTTNTLTQVRNQS